MRQELQENWDFVMAALKAGLSRALGRSEARSRHHHHHHHQRTQFFFFRVKTPVYFDNFERSTSGFPNLTAISLFLLGLCYDLCSSSFGREDDGMPRHQPGELCIEEPKVHKRTQDTCIYIYIYTHTVMYCIFLYFSYLI